MRPIRHRWGKFRMLSIPDVPAGGAECTLWEQTSCGGHSHTTHRPPFALTGPSGKRTLHMSAQLPPARAGQGSARLPIAAGPLCFVLGLGDLVGNADPSTQATVGGTMPWRRPNYSAIEQKRHLLTSRPTVKLPERPTMVTGRRLSWKSRSTRSIWRCDRAGCSSCI